MRCMNTMHTTPADDLDAAIQTLLVARLGDDLAIQRAPLLSVDSATGSVLERWAVTDAAGVRHEHVIKRLRPGGDWIARATNDDRMREHAIAAGGIFRSLPSSVMSAVVGTTRAVGEAAVIMEDVSPALVPPGDDPLTVAQLRQSLVALAALHSAFHGFPARLAGGLGLCSIGSWLTLLAPATAEREQDADPPDPVTPHILPGWDAFASLVPDAWAVVEPLLHNPAPLVDALRDHPATIVHADAKIGNLGFDGERTILLDWSMTLRGPGALDLGWYLAVNSARLPLPRADAIEIYRAERERLGRLPATGAAWQRELALSLLSGTLRLGWAKALGASNDDPVVRARERAELGYWADAALHGVAVMGDG